jgi:hypothetical protein
LNRISKFGFPAVSDLTAEQAATISAQIVATAE